jgi:hypothetical protein
MTEKMITRIGIALLMATSLAHANDLVWKVSVISALPGRPGVPAEFCREFTPDSYAAPVTQLQQTGAQAQNGMTIKYRTVQTQEQNQLYLTAIDGMISKKLDPEHSWYTRFYIYLQQLTPAGVADGVWSTSDCKGRLIATPQ